MTVNFHEMSAYFAAAGAALERQPLLERERDEALKARDEAQRHSQALEERIALMKQQIENGANAFAEVQAEADTFRNEAARNASQRDRLVLAFETAISMVQDEVRQIVPQPEPQEQLYATATDPNVSQNDRTHANNELATQQGVDADAPPPFPHTSDPAPVADSSPPSSNPATRFSGTTYVSHPEWISRPDWLAGGGTDYGYDWRPAYEGDRPDASRL